MDKLRMESMDMTKDNVQKIAALFPNCVTEHKDKDGNIVLGIDFEKLQVELGADLIGANEERYQFTWPDKRLAIREANTATTSTLRPCREESVDFDNTKNLYIEGDNLEVLKCLRETYLGKVKMIYIDPPYNTGNDFVYNDDFAAEASEYADNSGQKDEEGNRLFKNTESNGRFHTDWLNMMYPRLKVARDLLSEDGVIFISIDDNEVENLRKICDEIFGEANFIAQIIWQKKFSRANDAKYFSTMHDYVLCLCKFNILNNQNGWSIGLLPRGEELPSGYGNPDNDPRGPWTSVSLSAKSGSESLIYEIVTPSGRSCYPPSGRYWSCNKDTFKKWNDDKRIWYGTNGDGTPRKKTFLSEVQDGLRPNTILFQNEAGNNQEAKQETKTLFDDKGVFDGPKPVRLLDMLQTVANLGNDSIILDFFSGSATTAHSVIKQNLQNRTNRRFILVQLPELTTTDSEAYKAGYKNICEIGKERIRRAGNKIVNDMKSKIHSLDSRIDLMLNARPSATAQLLLLDDKKEIAKKIHEEQIVPLIKEKAQLEERLSTLDTGFRVLKLDTSNMNDVYYTPAATTVDLFSQDNIKEDRTDLDLLFQVMLECNVELSAKIETKTIGGKKVYFVEDNYLIACFDDNVTEGVITEIAKEHPYYFVLRDSSMASDNVADNFEQIFRSYSPDTVRKVL